MQEVIERLGQQFASVWWESDPGMPILGPTYTVREQLIREAHLGQFLDTLVAELEHPPRTMSAWPAFQERLSAAFGTFARSALDLEDRHLDILFSRGLPQLAIGFAQQARRFDPQVRANDIFQASRNAWTMASLQLLLGLPVQLTPAILAYSMLYPYSDNYLDDPAIPMETKRVFNERLARRLEGEHIVPANAYERAICDLMTMIEGQFDRAQSPQVFASLLAIHRAQNKSLRLLHRKAPPYEVDVLGIGFEKGGTSVLADGYLVADSLTGAQSAFMFGYGAFLQLVDDLQDVQQDCRNGPLTVFSQAAGRWPLDALVNRTFHFGARVLEQLDCFESTGLGSLKDLIQQSTTLLLLDAVGQAGRLVSRRYLGQIEVYSPFRFSFLRKCRKKLSRRRVSLPRLLDMFALTVDAG